MGGAFLILLSSLSFAQSVLDDKFIAKNKSAGPKIADPAVTVEGQSETLDELLSKSNKGPIDPIIQNNIAVLYSVKGEPQKALAFSLRSIAARPDIAETQLNLAGIYDQLKQPDKARIHAMLAVKLNPKYLRARSFACDLDIAAGFDKKAAECFGGVVADFPNDAESQMKFGIALMRSGQAARAKEVLLQSRLREPRNLHLINALAIVHFRMKDYEPAAALLKEAVEADPANNILRFNLGICYLALKNREAALSQYSLIKESSPDLAGKLYRGLFNRYVISAKR